MQLYAGLPIITNKITPQEQQGIPHHLLGKIGLHEQTWTVGTFVQNALKTIDEIRSRGRLPILVGGTHYYTQSLLFQDRLSVRDNEEDSYEFVENPADTWPILDEPTETLLIELKKVDPIMANRWHPNDRRKIQRSLQIYLQTGRKASEIYADQRAGANTSGEQQDTSFDGLKMRFPTLLFWVHAEREALQNRLNRRVEKMLEQGLLSEVETLSTFATETTSKGIPVDESRGIWVSIGYKEFKDHLQALQGGCESEAQLQKMKNAATEKTQAATRKYAKRQLQWIRIKLANALVEANSSDRLYLLDGSDIAKFDETAIEPALDITSRFMRDEDVPSPTSLSPVAKELLTPKRDYDFGASPEKWMKQHCTACDVTCVTPEQWDAHTKSKAHKKRLSKQRREHTDSSGEVKI